METVVPIELGVTHHASVSILAERFWATTLKRSFLDGFGGVFYQLSDSRQRSLRYKLNSCTTARNRIIAMRQIAEGPTSASDWVALRLRREPSLRP